MHHSFGQRVRWLREQLGLSRRDFAALLHLSERQLAGAENSAPVCDPIFLRLVIALDLDEKWLETGTGEPWLYCISRPTQEDKTISKLVAGVRRAQQARSSFFVIRPLNLSDDERKT